jgi:hypothetical protein
MPEVVPTTIPLKQCRKVVSHTTKFSFFTICSKGEQKETATNIASAQAPFIQKKQVEKIVAKRKYSLYTQSSHVARLVEYIEPLQQQVRDNVQKTKQHVFSSKASNSPRFRFSVYFCVISLLSFHAENNLDQWYQSRLLLIIFFSACPPRGLIIASWVLRLSLLRTIALAHPRNPPWRKKRKTTKYTILLIFCLRKL